MQLLAQKIYAQDKMTEQALWIGEVAALGLDLQTLHQYSQQIRAVTAEDLQRVAQQYLKIQHVTIAELIPKIDNKEART